MSRRSTLLRKAWRIDPSSKVIAEAFRSSRLSQGQRRLGRVSASRPVNSSTAAGPNSPPVAIVSQGLLGLTADEVTARLAVKPDRVNLRRLEGTIDRTVDLPS